VPFVGVDEDDEEAVIPSSACAGVDGVDGGLPGVVAEALPGDTDPFSFLIFFKNTSGLENMENCVETFVSTCLNVC